MAGRIPWLVASAVAGAAAWWLFVHHEQQVVATAAVAEPTAAVETPASEAPQRPMIEPTANPSSPPKDTPRDLPMQLAPDRSRDWVSNVRHEVGLARRDNDPFRAIPVLQDAADRGYGWAAGELHRRFIDCLRRQTAAEFERMTVENSARRREANDADAAARIAQGLVRKRRDDAHCAGVDEARRDSAWQRVVAMAKAGNEGARAYVAEYLEYNYRNLVWKQELVPGEPLELLAREWLRYYAMGGIRESQVVLAHAYCKGGLFAADPVQCHAWTRFLARNAPYPVDAGRWQQIDEEGAALTPAQREAAERRARELFACCSVPHI